VRSGLALLLAAALAAAEDDAELARTVKALVRDLGAPTADVRTLAQFQLASLGDRARPLLERVESDDPQVRRAIRQLTRASGRVEIELLPFPETPLPIGGTLDLEVRMVNNTDQTYYLLPDAARQGEAGPFRIRIGGRMLPPLGIDQVNWGTEGPATILPGAARLFRMSVGGASSPFRRPALYDISVIFDGKVARGYGAVAQQEMVLDDSFEQGPLFRETPPLQVHVVGRKADELEKALSSGGAKERESAAAELAFRDDEAVLPILRRHVGDPLLRLAAIRRLAALGAAEDFRLIYDATRDDNADVRKAAVLGLGKYRKPKARSRLLLLASDHELQTEAIQALRGHKHHATIDCYLALLSSPHLSPENIRVIRQTIYEWTKMSVDERQSEIDAFREWWDLNRERWAKENASDK